MEAAILFVMRKSAIVQSSAPGVLRFEAQMEQLTSPQGSWVVIIPADVSRQLQGMCRLEGTINGHAFRAPLGPGPAGHFLLQVNRAMYAGAAAEAGDPVQLAVLGPEPDPVAPVDLAAALAASPTAAMLWSKLSTEVQRDWLRWIEAARKPETRARRVVRTVQQLAEGKRRACCVNFYEYMLRRIEEEGTRQH